MIPIKKILGLTKTAAVVLLTTTVVSCSSGFLDENPDNRILVETPEELNAVLVRLLPRADFLFTEYMTDNYRFKSLTNTVVTVRDLISPSYRFRITKEPISRTDYPLQAFNAPTAWQRYYYRIQNTSLIISRAEGLDDSSDIELKNAILGQALAIRAYCHFMLVNLFAKSYNPDTAATDVGIPLITAYTGKAIEPYPRATVQEVYEAIEADLKRAIPLLEDNEQIGNSKVHFSAAAAQATLARVYLFSQQWESCIAMADNVLLENNSILDVKNIQKTYIDEQNQSEEYGKQYFNPDNENYILMSDTTTQYLSYFFSGFYPYGAADVLRANGRNSTAEFIVSSQLFGDTIPIKLLYFFSGAASGRHQIQLPLASVDMTYYNRAEAKIALGQLDAAKEDIQLLLDKDAYSNTTWTDQLETITDQDELMTYLLDSKQMRFFGEGIRWFDIKRHNLPVTHVDPSGSYTIDGTNPDDYVIQPPLEQVTIEE